MGECVCLYEGAGFYVLFITPPPTHTHTQIREAENLYYMDVPKLPEEAPADAATAAAFTRDNDDIARTLSEDVIAVARARDVEDVTIGNLLPHNTHADTLNGLDTRGAEWAVACCALRPYELRWLATRLALSERVTRLRFVECGAT
jgi:hypothetical protein